MPGEQVGYGFTEPREHPFKTGNLEQDSEPEFPEGAKQNRVGAQAVQFGLGSRLQGGPLSRVETRSPGEPDQEFGMGDSGFIQTEFFQHVVLERVGYARWGQRIKKRQDLRTIKVSATQASDEFVVD